MLSLRKKWLTALREICIVLAFLYGLATFSIPLSHTCKLADKGLHHCRSECSSQLLHRDEHVKVQYVAIYNQNDITETAKSHNHCCLACSYSFTSKAFKFCPNNSLCTIQTVIKTEVSTQLNFTKRSEWFSSISLRAPPVINS